MTQMGLALWHVLLQLLGKVVITGTAELLTLGPNVVAQLVKLSLVTPAAHIEKVPVQNSGSYASIPSFSKSA